MIRGHHVYKDIYVYNWNLQALLYTFVIYLLDSFIVLCVPAVCT